MGEAASATRFQPGDLVGQRYEVRSQLGKGGLGTVYRVYDRTLASECALKVMHPHVLGNSRAVEHFLREVLRSRRLVHPHIVRVHDLFQSGERYGLSMELLEGRSLQAWMDDVGDARREIPVETARRIASQVLEALEYAHAEKMIHRDIKPENIFLLGEEPEFTVKLLDFGVAKVLDPEALRSTSSSSGTGCYLAPEQLRPGPEVDARADLFAVGVVLYELLTGRAADGMLVRPSEQRPELGSEWDALLRSAMDELPGSRPPTATAMREQLQSLKVVTGGEPKRRTEPSPPGAGAGSDPEATSRSLDRQVRDADGMTEVLIPAGDFSMGSRDGEFDERPVRRVRLTRDFWMDEHPVTVRQYRAIVGRLPDGNARDDDPVVNVSWDDAVFYCQAVGGRLPTEAEWERAARGGLEEAQFPWGNEVPVTVAGSRANCREAGLHTTCPVRSFAPNSYGLHDMSGNVWEWVSDRYGPYEPGDVIDPPGCAAGRFRSLRGGSWYSREGTLRCAFRNGLDPTERSRAVGFRCVRDPQ